MENVKLFFYQKSQFDLVEKIKNKNKNRTRASISQFSEDGKQEFLMLPRLTFSQKKKSQKFKRITTTECKGN